MRKRVLGVIDATQGKRIDSIKRHNLFITFDTNHHSVRFCILPILRLFQRLHSLPVLSLFNVMGNQIMISQKSPTYPLDVTSSTRPNRIGHSAKETLLEHRPQTATPPQPLDHLRPSQSLSVAHVLLPLQHIADGVRSHHSADNAVVHPLQTGHVHRPHRLAHQHSSGETLHQSLHVITTRPLHPARRPRRWSGRHTPSARPCATARLRTPSV